MSHTLTDKLENPVDVIRDDEAGAYRIGYGNNEDAVGKAFFLDRDDTAVPERIFFHTEVDEEFGGRGLATVLVRAAVDETRAAGRLIVPVCPLVRAFLTKNAETYQGAFRPKDAEDLTWVREHTHHGSAAEARDE